MKKNASVFFLVSVLFILALFTGLSAENTLPQGLSDLLSGKTTDTQAVLSGLDDAQIPEAMTLCEVLKHKALHKETKLTPEAVDLFKTTLETRLKSSEEVSLTKTQTHTQRIPAREIIVEGHKLIIPEHFLAPIRFVITDSSPQGEAGTLLPEIQVQFIGGKPPIKAKILLDGKEIPTHEIKNGFMYRPSLHPASVLSMGTHRVEAVLTDSSQEIASTSWSFTVGLKPVTSPTIPTDAPLVGSFSVPISTLVPGSSVTGDVSVFVFESSDGKRLLEYRMSDDSGKNKLDMKTTSLFFLHQFIRNPNRRDELQILPKTGSVFAGRETRFSYVYSGEGQITKTAWTVQEPMGSDLGSFDTPDILWEVKKWSHLKVKVDVEFVVDGTVYHAGYEQQKDVTALDVSSRIDYSQYVTFETSGSGTANVSGERVINNLYTHEFKVLNEGDSFSFPPSSPGTLTVTRSRWKMVGGTAEAMFEDPLALKTNLLFSSFGFVEFVHDIAVAYDWEDEHYEMEVQPEKSYLYGRFSYKASTEFKQFPPGIIFNTSRYLSFKTINLEINGEKRVITSQPSWYCPVDPPIRLAESVLFPDSDPIIVNAVMPVAIRKTATAYAYLPDPENFRILLKYDKPEQAIKDEIPCCVYFVAGDAGKLKKLAKRGEWEDFFGYARPLTDWLGVKTFSSPAPLLQVEIDPENPEVFEGQDFKFTGKVTPKQGFGSGEFTENTNTLDLLEGYKAQKVESLDWKALLLPPQTPIKQGQDWAFAFKPKDGTGTYEVIASTVVEVKEIDTKTVAKAGGIGSTSAVVSPGLRILSPVDRFFYPLSYPVRVETSMDEDIEEWSKIQWSLNGQQWLPDSIGPKPVLKLEKPGDYVLKAVYKTSDNIELSQEVAFSVKPVKVSIFPERKVLTYSQGLVFPLQGKLDFDGKLLEDSEKPLDLGNGVTARVTKVDWQAVTKPDDGVELKIEKNLLAPSVVFKRECAVTALATVTVTISKPVKTPNGETPKTQIVEETYILPAGRGDLWGVAGLVWSPLNGTFPQKAIAKAGRTFSLKDGAFAFQGKEYVWNQESGLKDPIPLLPAFPNPGFQSPEGKEILFAWAGPENQTSSQTQFTPTFKNVGNFDVTLNSSLSFGHDGEVPFTPKKNSISAVSLESLIDYYVDPQSFAMTIGDTLTFTFLIKAKEPPQPVPTVKSKEDGIPLLDGAYKLTLENVDWVNVLNGHSSSVFSGLEFPFTPNNVGSATICATASCRLEEITIPAKPAEKRLLFIFLQGCSQGLAKKPNIDFYANEKPLGLGSETFYLGQKIDLSFKAFNQAGEEIIVKDPIWQVASPVIAYFNIAPETQMAGNAMEVQAFSQKKLSFYLYDYDPNKTTKTIELTFSFADAVHSSSTILNYSRPTLSSSSCQINSPGIVNRNGSVAIGFQPNPPGFAIDIELINSSDITFEVNSVQLINHDCERKLSSNTYQYLQTNPTRMRFPSTTFWLDTVFPYNSISQPLAPGGPKVIRALRDSPWFGLESPFFEVTELIASSSFLTYVIVRPNPAQVTDSIWCPINCFFWSWGGKANKEEGNWVGVNNSFFINKLELTNSFPKWEDKFIPPTATASGVPPWRDGKKNTGANNAY